MDGGGAIGPRKDRRHGDDNDIHESVFSIAVVTRIGEGLEVGSDGFDIHELCGHVDTVNWSGDGATQK